MKPAIVTGMVCAFSVFTHLHHSETYLYLQDIRRVLRTNGKLIFSFLEFAEPRHWEIFEQTVIQQRYRSLTHKNEFIERNAIRLWCEKLGYQIEAFIAGDAAPWGDAGPLGQSLVVLRRPLQLPYANFGRSYGDAGPIIRDVGRKSRQQEAPASLEEFTIGSIK